MQISDNMLVILVSASIVFGLSVIGSFIVWLNSTAWGDSNIDESQANRWKWMMIVFVIITCLILLAKP